MNQELDYFRHQTYFCHQRYFFTFDLLFTKIFEIFIDFDIILIISQIIFSDWDRQKRKCRQWESGYLWLCFLHSIFRFWFLVSFDDEVMKIQKYYVIFVYILQGKMGKTEKTGKKITQLKWPKYQKPKDENMGWIKQLWWNFQVRFGLVCEW